MNTSVTSSTNLTATLFDAELRLRVYLVGLYRMVSLMEKKLSTIPEEARYRRSSRGSCASARSRLARAINNRKAKISLAERKLNALTSA